jgi:SAM-dependent methyltransferase
VRSHLINAIIEGEGEKQLKDPKEILPLKMPSSIPYREAIDFLRFNETEKALRAAAEAGNQQVEKLLKQREQILKVDEVFRLLVGRKWITDRKTGEQRIGAFWAAFETRKKNDQEGITAARKKEREEAAKREAIFKEAAKEIIERGGFVVEVPIVKEIRGNKVKVGEEKGVFRLEKKRSKVRVVRDPKTGREIEKGGNEYWEIVEIFGATGGLKVGATSPLDMSAFPQWFREGAKPYFVMRGKNFIERLTTQEK